MRDTSNDLGRGKLIGVQGDLAHVAYFDSPAVPPVLRDLPARNLKPAPLLSQQRVYWTDPETGSWQVGRIDEAGSVPGHHFGTHELLYWVALPNKSTRRIPASQLQVRWDQPIGDPVALLAARTTETPFWHEGRASLMRSLMDQRARCGGLTGLLSASIDLEAHQYRVVHRVLNDPVQRYLLADEVGLGKTIEAGAILRQYVLEHPEDHRALVVVPEHLREQWAGELRDRFHLGARLGKSILVVTIQEFDVAFGAPGMLIIDEAHHPAALAHSETPQERALFASLAALAREAPRLLLLSATPVLRNEDGFLAMLHLLDPAAYPLEDRDGFRQRVQQRQVIAELLADLHDDASPMFLEDALNGLVKTIRDDERLVALVDACRPMIEDDSADPIRMAALGALRTHIGELYRLHRRLIRNRRSSVVDLLRGRNGARRIPCVDPGRALIEEALDEWRADALVAVERGQAPKDVVLRLWGLFLNGLLSHPRVLHALVRTRLDGSTPSPTLWKYSAKELFSLTHPSLFDGEPERLRDLDERLAAYDDPRVRALLDHINNAPGTRLVVFVDRPAIANWLAKRLGDGLGQRVRRHGSHADIDAFLADSTIQVLICDHQSEEGLNLQHSPATILHYDLPLSPNRIEQRIGRLDRFGAKQKASSLVFEETAPFAGAWLDCLTEEIQVFSQSVASLQYVLEEHLTELRRTSFEGGVAALEEFRSSLRDKERGLQAELNRIQHQENLDAMEVDSSVEAGFEAMEELDQDHERLVEELERWLVRGLYLRRHKEDEFGLRVRYAYEVKGSRRTLVPVDDFLRWFGSSVETGASAHSRLVATQVLTWSRYHAARNSLAPVRLGNALFDGTWAHARVDDRGSAFCMWRHQPDYGGSQPLLVFRFDYLIEADTAPILAWLQEHPRMSPEAIRRRLDALFPPSFKTLWMSDTLDEVQDEAVITALSAPYKSGRTGGGRDYNIRSEHWQYIDARLELGDWPRLARDAELAARERLNVALDLSERVAWACQRLARERDRVEAQFAARLERLGGARAVVERDALAIERSLYLAMESALRAPHVRPDAAGAVFLADLPPVFAEGP